MDDRRSDTDLVAPGRLRPIQGRVGSRQHLFPVLARVQGERHAAADRQMPGIGPRTGADLQVGDRRPDPLRGSRRGIEGGVGHDHEEFLAAVPVAPVPLTDDPRELGGHQPQGIVACRVSQARR